MKLPTGSRIKWSNDSAAPRRWLAAWGCAQGQTVTYTLIAGNCPFCQRLPPRSPGVSGRRTVSRKSREACSPAPSLPHVVIVVCVRESPTGEDSSAKCACCRFGVVKRGASVIIPPRAVGAHPRAPPCTPAHSRAPALPWSWVEAPGGGPEGEGSFGSEI